MGDSNTAGKLGRSLTWAFVIAAWGLTIALVYHLLSGTFESGRSCQTDCVKTIYWSAFIAALAGIAAGFATRKSGGSLSFAIKMGALFLLLAMFAVTMFIGTFL